MVLEPEAPKKTEKEELVEWKQARRKRISALPRPFRWMLVGAPGGSSESADQDLFPWRTILEKKAEEEAAQNVQQIIAAPQETESQPSQPPSTPAPAEDKQNVADADVSARMAEREAS